MLEHYFSLSQNLAFSENQRQTSYRYWSVPFSQGQRPAVFPTGLRSQCSTPTGSDKNPTHITKLGNLRISGHQDSISTWSDPCPSLLSPTSRYLAAPSKRRFPRSLGPATPLLGCFHRVPLHRIQSFKVPPTTKPRAARP